MQTMKLLNTLVSSMRSKPFKNVHCFVMLNNWYYTLLNLNTKLFPATKACDLLQKPTIRNTRRSTWPRNRPASQLHLSSQRGTSYTKFTSTGPATRMIEECRHLKPRRSKTTLEVESMKNLTVTAADAVRLNRAVRQTIVTSQQQLGMFHERRFAVTRGADWTKNTSICSPPETACRKQGFFYL